MTDSSEEVEGSMVESMLAQEGESSFSHGTTTSREEEATKKLEDAFVEVRLFQDIISGTILT